MYVPGKAGILLFRARAIDADKTKQHKAQLYKEVTFNEDGCFDKDTGIFTAPVEGAYVFSARVESNEAEVQVCSHFMIGDSVHTIIKGEYAGKLIAVLVQLKSNQKVWMKALSPANKYDTTYRNSFYCTLVQAQP